MKTYFTWISPLIGLFIWFLVLGPRMLSGSTEVMLIWLFGTILGVIPLLGWFLYSQWVKGAKLNDENNS